MIILEKTPDPECSKNDKILLCNSFVKLNKKTKGVLPIDLNLLTDTDDYHRIEKDLRFFREIAYIKEHTQNPKIKRKYENVYDRYKKLAEEEMSEKTAD